MQVVASRPVETLASHQPAAVSFHSTSLERVFCLWIWLHYNEATDSIVCFLCAKPQREQKMNSKSAAF